MPASLLKQVTASLSPKKTSGTNTANLFQQFKNYKSDTWTKIQEESTLKLFSAMADKVPAYKSFLQEKGFRKGSVRSPKDFSNVPAVTKKNYLHVNAIPKLFWKGSTKDPHVLTSTSGSTGRPTYFARSEAVDKQSAMIHELIFTTSSLKLNASTLVIDCFGMGVWIGGLITYQAFEKMSRKGYPISILTPGINKAEILKALKDLAPSYEQIILAGYPPFLKDVIDEAVEQGILFSSHKVMLLFAAEAFTETFRDHVAEKAGIQNVLTDTANIYGSADLGTMAFETPVSILIRRLAVQKPELFSELFNGTRKTPTLAQYVPQFVTFEAHEGEILITGDSAMPLVRYSIGDNGGTFTYDAMAAICKKHGISLAEEIKKAGISKTVLELPFVYVYERIDLATTLYGLQIYPETIKEVLIQKQFSPSFTGKLTLITKYDDAQDQYLEINIEQKPGQTVSKVLTGKLISEMMKNLREKNSEFHELSSFLGNRAEPKLVFWPYEDPLYFKPGTKQSWVLHPKS